MHEKTELRNFVKENLDSTMSRLNSILQGKHLKEIEPVLARLGRGAELPHWYTQLKKEGVLPNLDGKTIGSVLEMLFVAVVESFTLKALKVPPLHVNPARGVDIPDLDLGVKSPSTNYCTSEPFFSAYERLYGNEYDVVVMLTDYQEAKSKPPLKLQILKWQYLSRTEIADTTLCQIALKHRDDLLKINESWAKKLFRFLAYVNQSDWLGRRLLQIVASMNSEEQVKKLVMASLADYDKQNKYRASKGMAQIPEDDRIAIESILAVSPFTLGVIDAADNWVAFNLQEAGRLPNENEWNRLKNGPLDGKIGMSFALQWRYNFGRVFGDIQQEGNPSE